MHVKRVLYRRIANKPDFTQIDTSSLAALIEETDGLEEELSNWLDTQNAFDPAKQTKILEGYEKYLDAAQAIHEQIGRGAKKTIGAIK